MNIQVRKKVCRDCPWKRANKSHLDTSTLVDRIKKGVVSPCHMEMMKFTGVANKGVEYYSKVSPVFVVCKGLANVVNDIEHEQPIWGYIGSLMNELPKENDLMSLKEVL